MGFECLLPFGEEASKPFFFFSKIRRSSEKGKFRKMPQMYDFTEFAGMSDKKSVYSPTSPFNPSPDLEREGGRK